MADEVLDACVVWRSRFKRKKALQGPQVDGEVVFPFTKLGVLPIAISSFCSTPLGPLEGFVRWGRVKKVSCPPLKTGDVVEDALGNLANLTRNSQSSIGM